MFRVFRSRGARPHRPPACLLVLLALAPPALVGCAHDTTAADRHARELRESMARLQADQDRVGLPDDDPRSDARAAPSNDAGVRLPVPRTIQLGGPESDGEDDDPNAPTARPKIELSGPGGAPAPRAPRGSRNREGGRDTRIEMLGPPPDGAPADAAPVPQPEPSAKQAPAPDADVKTTDTKKAPRSAPRDRARGEGTKAAPKETR